MSKEAKMVSAIQDMMTGFGIPSIEFADDNGKTHGRIDAPKPEVSPAKSRRMVVERFQSNREITSVCGIGMSIPGNGRSKG